jgi:hypothetical protein
MSYMNDICHGDRRNEAFLTQNERFDDWTSKLTKALAALREWQALEYTGHFIDVEGEPRERIKCDHRKD